MHDSPSHIAHIEIPAPDLDAARRFYADLFGWTFTELPGMDYAMWSNGREGGGLDPKLQPSEHGVNIVIETDDIDAKLAEIEAAGGATLKPKTHISDEHGDYACFRDPNGNRLSLWSASATG